MMWNSFTPNATRLAMMWNSLTPNTNPLNDVRRSGPKHASGFWFPCVFPQVNHAPPFAFCPGMPLHSWSISGSQLALT